MCSVGSFYSHISVQVLLSLVRPRRLQNVLLRVCEIRKLEVHVLGTAAGYLVKRWVWVLLYLPIIPGMPVLLLLAIFLP